MTAPVVRIMEVGPRDGLQNEPGFLPTSSKVALIDELSRTGLTDIEVSSFVSPRWVPQLADADEVFRLMERVPGVRYWALVPNLHGLERALAARADGIAVLTAASETFSRRNTNSSAAESLARAGAVAARATTPVRAYISTAFHCPYEGPVDPATVRDLTVSLLDLGCSEVSLGDTIGQATPAEVRALLARLLKAVDPARLALHCHDTLGQAIANCLAAAELGVTAFDGSVGGLGGCPYAPGAAGNVATESLVRAFAGRTGVDLTRLESAAKMLRQVLRMSPEPRRANP
jgi:hydroxymethylglutaryl-CoA lyase